MKNLKVRIPQKYKYNLSYRFNPENAEPLEVENYIGIKMECSLCNDYPDLGCGGCPFEKFKGKRVAGCINWIKKVCALKYQFVTCGRVVWHKKNNEKVIIMLKELRRKAKMLIEWV